MPMRTPLWLLGLGLIAPATAPGQDGPPLADYFRAEVGRIEARPLAGLRTGEQWKRQRPDLRREMLDMLGLWPLPEKADLDARVTGTVERPEFVVEKVLFQSRPGLYVTGDLYRPKSVTGKLPAVLYVCGHSRVEKDGVIFGNKAHYQHHAEWFAANGYVCLVLDTLQLGEVPGVHHGTYDLGQWWWLSRGYTPAGVEAWNGVRGIDYLISRPEVDPRRIGVTGRSGGGATSWWLGAIDDRLAAVVPVAGITDLRDHVVGGAFPGPHKAGVVEGHCDCMYMVNTYRWDYPTVAALVAPKPLLVENTDADPIFPEGGVRRVFDELETVYGWYGARDRLGLVIGSGGHADTEELRHPAFAFLEKWLKGKEVDPASIEEPDRTVPVEELKVLKVGETPEGSENATIQESFVPRAETPPVPEDQAGWGRLRERWLARLRTRAFAGWPSSDEAPPLGLEWGRKVEKAGVRLRSAEFTSQEGIRLTLWAFEKAAGAPASTMVAVLDAEDWSRSEGLIRAFEAAAVDPEADPGFALLRHHLDDGQRVVLIAPRGVGPTAWPEDQDVQMRRRFYLLGQTLDGMRSWDVIRGLAALRESEEGPVRPLTLYGRGESASVALFAAAFDPEVDSVVLDGLDPDADKGPAFLNLDRVLGMPQAVALLAPRPVRIKTDRPGAWGWAKGIKAGADWLTIESE
jgi:dienelactone hydrolase